MKFTEENKEAVIEFDGRQIIIKKKEEKEMKGIKLEEAYVKYDEDGNYDYTIQSKILDFESDEEARKYVMNNIEKDYEYYFYESQEDLNNNNHYNVLICNNMKKTLSVKNYKNNATVFLYDELNEQEEIFDINFDGINFESNDDLEDYIREEILDKVSCLHDRLDEDSLDDVVMKIWVAQNDRIK